MSAERRDILVGELQDAREAFVGAVADVDPDRLRESIAVVFQDFAQYLFDAASNIAMGRIERREDRARVERAAREAGAHDFLAELP